jgi:small GTP-binding protein
VEVEDVIRKKLILLGYPSVGKTSLVARWTRGIFSERYLTTIGVKIDKKAVEVDGQEVILQIWDLAGDVEIKGPAQAYIRGADICLLVADGTRKETLRALLGLWGEVMRQVGKIPVALALNKADLPEKWVISEAEISRIRKKGVPVFKTSAKSGGGVEEAFIDLTHRSLQRSLRGVA